jgi:uncharacterized membrane protein YkvA (DUF1232 family)
MKCPGCSREIDDDSSRCPFCDYNISLYKSITEKGVRKIQEKDVDKALKKSEIAREKAKRLFEKGGPFTPILKRIEIFISMVRDYRRKEYRQIPWRVIATLVFAILYFINPFDLIIDFIPGIGFIDDAAVIAFVFASLEFELKRYAKWKGIDFE